MIIVIKIGSSSLTKAGKLFTPAIEKLCHEIAQAKKAGHAPVLVSSGATALGRTIFASAQVRMAEPAMSRAFGSAGQVALISAYERHLARHDSVAAQVLLAPTDFWIRKRYLRSRGTLHRLLELGAVPIINENDALADNDISFGDNDRLAALVAHLLKAEKLLLLTDTDGIYSSDPSVNPEASLIAKVEGIDHTLEQMATGSRSGVGRGGMSSKVAAAKIASWSGVETVIAKAARKNVVADAIAGKADIGTTVAPELRSISARKLWIAFAQQPSGRVVVDVGARKAVERRNSSLLAAGVVGASGSFAIDSIVDIADSDGTVFARGVTRWSQQQIDDHLGKKTSEIPDEISDEIIHKDDLALLPQ